MKDTGIEVDLTRHNKDGEHPVDAEGWIDAGSDLFIEGCDERAAHCREKVSNRLYIEGYCSIEGLRLSALDEWLSHKMEGRTLG